MPRRRKKQAGGKKSNPNLERFHQALAAIQIHPLFQPLADHFPVRWGEGLPEMPEDAWGVLSNSITANPKKKGSREEWMYFIAHCLLHLGLGHRWKIRDDHAAWNVACDIEVFRLLEVLRIGKRPEDVCLFDSNIPSGEDAIYAKISNRPTPKGMANTGMAGPFRRDMIMAPREDIEKSEKKTEKAWQSAFARGLRQAVTFALQAASGMELAIGKPSLGGTEAERARQWFISSYPLLGSMAASFQIIEDQGVMKREDIYVAAVNDWLKEIFINPLANLNPQELRFVIGHELLHAGLRHAQRGQGRDPFLWNVACDYVINGWLMEMGIGHPPNLGLLFDPELTGMSAETVYDRMAGDMRRYRKLVSLRGVGIGDILLPKETRFWNGAEGVSLDEYYRRALCNGLAYHECSGRGLLPAGLVESIRALDHPPIQWEVELARWFDNYFQPLEKRRSFARPSRRQSSTPDIPRPSWAPLEGAMDGRTFGVILDTSGSMSRNLLALALGAISSYALSRDVPMARVVFCDAAAYDQGYMPVEAIGGRVRIKGRGGTRLQPGIDLLERAPDFPKNGPLLIITDGICDVLIVKRDHAYLMPSSGRLPFRARGPVFRITG